MRSASWGPFTDWYCRARHPSSRGTIPPPARTGDAAAAWPALNHLLRARTAEVQNLSRRPVQTNEVGRAAALVGGFLEVVRRFALPLRVLEVGASGGLLLNWDRYGYEARGETWGPERSPVRLCSYSTPPIPPFDTTASVVSHGGCDPWPVDASTEDGRLTLQSYVWPDQLHRFRLLKAALEVARAHSVTVERAGAAEWTRARLSETKTGVATVVYHSIVEQYLGPEERRLCHDSGGCRSLCARLSPHRMAALRGRRGNVRPRADDVLCHHAEDVAGRRRAGRGACWSTWRRGDVDRLELAGSPHSECDRARISR